MSESSTRIGSLGIEQVAEALRAAGFRATLAEQNSRPMIQSAVQGLGFIVTPGNRASDDASRYVDWAFTCLIRFDGPLTHEHVARWNQNKRFARLYIAGQTLVLSMDAFVGSGNAELSLRAYCELWDRVVQEFIAFLRELPTAVAAAA
ncbi:MAG: YbjN domain-containing protein [Panacagrimonas sp.]